MLCADKLALTVGRFKNVKEKFRRFRDLRLNIGKTKVMWTKQCGSVSASRSSVWPCVVYRRDEDGDFILCNVCGNCVVMG